MSDGKRILWIVGLFAAATVGLLAGIWIGGEMEARVNQEFLMKADLPDECWEKIAEAADEILSAQERGGGAASGD